MREEIYSTVFFYYGTDDKSRNTLSGRLECRNPVDGEAFGRAVASVEERYPYLKKKVVKAFGRKVIEDNDLPFVVVKGDRSPVLGSAEANYHLLAFSWDEKNIYIHAFHGLVDGVGITNVTKTMMYYYVLYRENHTADPKGFRLTGDVISEAEYADPFPRKRITGIEPLCRTPRFLGAMKLSKELKKMGHSAEWDPHVYHISIPRNSLNDMLDRYGASPGPFISVLMAEAVRRVHPGSRRKVCVGMPINFRPALKAFESYRCMIYNLHLIYDDKVRSLPIDKQCTAFRGRIFLQSDPGSVLAELNFQRKIFNIFRLVPGRALKRLAAKGILAFNMGDETFAVSHTGQSKFGEIGAYFEQFEALVDLCGEELMIEIMLINDTYSLTFMQFCKDSIYVDAFMEQMKETGLVAEITGVEKFDPPRVSI
ncbi:hypothetical protein SAMN02910456_02563 [Ruminococcaceae bacterium YRB3002]|nr:hypothetical protein SAMN02910456_02563 [Ruminococcaceae bacterium YRB3002]